MPSCVIKTCKNRSTSKKKASGVTYHRFPGPEHEKREAWIKLVQKSRNDNTWLPSDHALICSDHFKDEDKYITKTGRLYLKKCAVPYELKLVEPKSEPLSDSETIFDTPREIVLLKNKLLKEITAKKVLADKLKKMQRQNKYLKERCESYKLMVKRMKNKFRLDAPIENEFKELILFKNK